MMSRKTKSNQDCTQCHGTKQRQNGNQKFKMAVSPTNSMQVYAHIAYHAKKKTKRKILNNRVKHDHKEAKTMECH